MSMNTHIYGIKPPDKKWKAMKAVWDACEKANIEKPDEVLAFFDQGVPDDAGVLVNMEELDCCTEFDKEGEQGFEQGFEIDIEKMAKSQLTKDIKIIRFCNSW